EQLKNIQSILEDDVIDSIRQAFQQFNEIPKTFDDYQKITIRETTLHKVINDIINEWLILPSENPQTSYDDKIKKTLDDYKVPLTSSLKLLQLLANKAAYLKKVDFIRHVLNSSNKKEILFDNILT